MAFWSSLALVTSTTQCPVRLLSTVETIHHLRVCQQVRLQPSLFLRTLTYEELYSIRANIHLPRQSTNCNLPNRARYLLLVAGRWLLARWLLDRCYCENRSIGLLPPITILSTTPGVIYSRDSNSC